MVMVKPGILPRHRARVKDAFGVPTSLSGVRRVRDADGGAANGWLDGDK